MKQQKQLQLMQLKRGCASQEVLEAKLKADPTFSFKNE
jgi:hypothetical protein